MQVVDSSHIINREINEGINKKHWVSVNGTQYLLKFYMCLSECIHSWFLYSLAEAVGVLTAQKTELAVFRDDIDRLCVLCEDFDVKNQFKDAQDALNIEHWRLFEPFYWERVVYALTHSECVEYLYMTVYDYLIGNIDRNLKNWGFMDGHFAPLFDNSDYSTQPPSELSTEFTSYRGKYLKFVTYEEFFKEMCDDSDYEFKSIIKRVLDVDLYAVWCSTLAHIKQMAYIVDMDEVYEIRGTELYLSADVVNKYYLRIRGNYERLGDFYSTL